jgi:hypothetical protein
VRSERMRNIVFCGPTISPEDAQRELDAETRPPAKRGDILRAAIEGADVIVLIDGYFDRVPSVWHKEILFAMAQGCHVFGASSMGALRAAELFPFGMVGVGEIFEGFLRGDLEDDDEVTVAHGDAEASYRQNSEAMVNIRWTLRAAVRAGIVSEPTRELLEREAKGLHYDRRGLRSVLQRVERTSRLDSELTALRDWLPSGRVDQKRLDARAVLKHVAALAVPGMGKKTVTYRLAETDGWQTLFAETGAAMGRATAGKPPHPAVADELRSRGELGSALVAANMRQLAAARLTSNRKALNPRAIEFWIEDFRRERGLLSDTSFEAWLGEQALSEDSLAAFFTREASVRATRAELRLAAGDALEDELRATGSLPAVECAALRKQAILESLGLSTPTLDDASITEEDLWAWFFGEHLKLSPPPSAAAFAARQGSDVDELRSTALRALLYDRLENKTLDRG